MSMIDPTTDQCQSADAAPAAGDSSHHSQAQPAHEQQQQDFPSEHRHPSPIPNPNPHGAARYAAASYEYGNQDTRAVNDSTSSINNNMNMNNKSADAMKIDNCAAASAASATAESVPAAAEATTAGGRQHAVPTRHAACSQRVGVAYCQNAIPQNARDITPVDKMLSDEIKSLSLHQRERVYEDIHGVSANIPETPTMLAQKLQELNRFIHQTAVKPAYDLATQQSPEFVTDESFRLMFLRSTSYDAQLAADRLIAHFETKFDLFGTEYLGRRITFDDLDPVAQEVLYSAGYISLLPVRDSSGRAVVVSLERFHRQFYRTENPTIFHNRILFYIIMSILQDDVETQRNGVVWICYGIDFTPKLDQVERKVWWGSCAVLNCVPMRIVGFHYCYNRPQLKPFIALIGIGLQRVARCRMRLHNGTSQECLYTLMTFGVPVQEIPVNHKGSWKRGTYFTNWLERRQMLERNLDKYPNAIELPACDDVLLGKGKPVQDHVGNKYLHEVVAMHYEQYNACATRLQKRVICQTVLTFVKGMPAKFLKREECGIWVEISDEAAKDKIGHCFRRRREVINLDLKHRKSKLNQQEQLKTYLVANPERGESARKRFRVDADPDEDERAESLWHAPIAVESCFSATLGTSANSAFGEDLASCCLPNAVYGMAAEDNAMTRLPQPLAARSSEQFEDSHTSSQDVETTIASDSERAQEGTQDQFLSKIRFPE